MNIMRQVAANYGKRLEEPFYIKAGSRMKVKLTEDGLWYQDHDSEVWYYSETLLVKLIIGQAVITK